ARAAQGGRHYQSTPQGRLRSLNAVTAGHSSVQPRGAIHPRIEQQLRAAGVTYTVRRHADLATPIDSPLAFAAALGYAPGRITKTLFLKSSKPEAAYFLVTLPANARADLKRLTAVLEAG